MREMHNIVVGRDEADAKAYGEQGTGIIGRHYVGEKKDAHLTNPVRMDLARPHIVGIFGKRGTGKSYTMGVIAEEMTLLEEEVRKNLSCVIVDSMGIFWSLKSTNDTDMAIFVEWNLKPQRFNARVLIPEGQARKFAELGIPFDAAFSISPKELTSEDWALTFNIELDSEMGVLLQRALKRIKKLGPYFLEDIAVQIKNDKTVDEHTRSALINRFAVASEWGIFERGSVAASEKRETLFDGAVQKKQSFGGPETSPVAAHEAKAEHLSLSSVSDIVLPGRITVVDLSMVEEWSVRALIIGLLTKKILEARVAARRIEEMSRVSGEYVDSKMPMPWIMIDEAHQFLPSKGTTPATAPLLQCIKIGREPGVSMVFATQQPNKLHEAAISQCDLVISHRLTSKKDIDSLKEVMQTYLKYDLQEYIDALPRASGAAIILDDNSERIYAAKIRPRLSRHVGGSPTAIKEIG